MQSFKSKRSSLKARVAGVVFGLVCSLASLAAVFAVFASVSGGLDPSLAKVKGAPATSEVASKMPGKRVRS
jgi:hypothetical protein